MPYGKTSMRRRWQPYYHAPFCSELRPRGNLQLRGLQSYILL